MRKLYFTLCNIGTALIIASCSVLTNVSAEANKDDTFIASNSPEIGSVKESRLYLRKNCPLDTKKADIEKESVSGIVAGIIGVIGPELIQSGINILGQSIIRASGKNNNTKTTKASVSDFYYRASYNIDSSLSSSATSLLEMAASNGEEAQKLLEEDSFSADQVKGVVIAPKFSEYKCVVFIRGEFSLPEDNSSVWIPRYSGIPADGMGQFSIKGEPDIYFQALLESESSTQYRVKPHYLFYNKSLFKSSRKNSDLQIIISMKDLASNEKKLVSQSMIQFEQFRFGKAIGPNEFGETSTDVMFAPPQDAAFSEQIVSMNSLLSNYRKYKVLAERDPKDSAERDKLDDQINYKKCIIATTKKEKCDSQNEIINLERKRNFIENQDRLSKAKSLLEARVTSRSKGGPFALEIEVIETKDINEWLAALGEAIAKTKQETAGIIGSNIIPSQKEQAKRAKTIEKLNSLNMFLQAVESVKVAEEKLRIAQLNGDPILVSTATIELLEKQRLANIAAINAGEDPPY